MHSHILLHYIFIILIQIVESAAMSSCIWEKSSSCVPVFFVSLEKELQFLSKNCWSDRYANMFSIYVALTKDNSHLLNSFCVMKMIALPFLKSFFKTDLSVYSFFAVFLKQLMIKCVDALKKQQFFFKK